MENMYIDWVSVCIAAVANMVIGFFWYSKWLFGQKWTKLSRHTMTTKEPGFAYAMMALNSFVIAFFLALFETYCGVATVTDGMVVGFLCWLGFVATTQISSVLWEKQSFHLYLINTGYKLFSFIVMGGLIGA
jgi:hypothetical protein